jgi:MoaA/NifB/PqqE/SkfB family radical SAM enzyme
MNGFLDSVKPEMVILTGGEALLHPQIIEIFELVRSYKIKIGLFTNGQLLTKDNVQILAKHEIDIQVSYFEHNQKLLKKMALAKKEGLNVLTSTIFLKSVLKNLDQILSDISIFDSNAFLYPTPIGKNINSKVIPGEKWLEMIKILTEKSKKYKNNLYFELAYLKKGIKVPNKFKCGIGKKEVVFVDSNGKEVPCCLMTDLKQSKKYEKTKIGCAALKAIHGRDPRLSSSKNYIPVCPLIMINGKNKYFEYNYR